MLFDDVHHIHFVGIGGFGLSAIARVLLERGFTISGSDRAKSPLAAALERDGASVFIGHNADQIAGADMLIVSSAIPATNPEIAAAHSQGIPIYKRQSVLPHLMGDRRVIAVAGTHGKTTTTAMIVHLLQQTGQAPGYIVGGVMANTGTNAANGTGDTFVIEADEYDNAFLGLYPELAVITNVEYDHPDFFTSPEMLMDAFRQFLKRLNRDHGILLACADDHGAMTLYREHREQQRLAFTYGTSDNAVLTAQNIEIGADGTAFDVLQGGTVYGRAQLPLPGVHNVQNALAALYVAGHGHDLPLPDVIPHLQTFRSTGRRFDVRADVNGIVVIDDYAHHPTAIRAVLAAAKARYPQRTLWTVWQPHTYSRTQTLWNDYITAFDATDHLLITDIYAAREQPIPEITSANLAAAMTHADVRHTGTRATTAKTLITEVHPNAVILILSAGDAPQIGIDFLEART